MIDKSDGSSAKLCALEKIFTELVPANPDTDRGLPVNSLARYIALELVEVSESGGSKIQPRAPKEALRRLTSEVDALLAALDELPAVLHLELARVGLSHFDLRSHLAPWKAAMGKLAICAKGAPRKDRALRIAHLVGDRYQFLTGERPTVSFDEIAHKDYGEFPTLLRKVFDVLEIEASASSMARKVVKDRKTQVRLR